MPKLPLLTPKKLLRVLREAGFEIDHITGSHYILYHPISKKRVVIPFHSKTLPRGTTHAILKSAEIDRKELKKHL